MKKIILISTLIFISFGCNKKRAKKEQKQGLAVTHSPMTQEKASGQAEMSLLQQKRKEQTKLIQEKISKMSPEQRKEFFDQRRQQTLEFSKNLSKLPDDKRREFFKKTEELDFEGKVEFLKTFK